MYGTDINVLNSQIYLLKVKLCNLFHNPDVPYETKVLVSQKLDVLIEEYYKLQNNIENNSKKYYG
ncbi:MAG: hypothetical protein JG777_1053 [Clostridia bacterium]|jgi:hypothetical protein|uniref:hypothetical protein n=1 Tax=Petroclostridium xylanilyticum TaxID=1792311 RepID=UPI000B980D36|nr:hypothetical protein [Petroclostridium xylanilyticum]MBZ4645564.1 hypothetical protein [Clostridia bacterium]